ncbi:MAG: hypothetical protein WCS70_06820 [Verrucomicrobiota bacterium]
MKKLYCPFAPITTEILDAPSNRDLADLEMPCPEDGCWGKGYIVYSDHHETCPTCQGLGVVTAA